MKKIIFVVPPEVQILDLNGPLHAFYEAKEFGALLDLQFISIYKDSSLATSCAGLQFANLIPYDKVELLTGDYIFVPGITYSKLNEIRFIAECKEFFKWLVYQYSEKVNICSICTGAFLLAEAGILNQKNCTTHWNRIDDFEGRYPKVNVFRNRLFIKDGNVYTSAGVASGIDLALHIIEQEWGARFVIDIAKQMVIYFRRGESDSQINPYLQYRNHMEDHIHKIQDFLSSNLEESHVIDEIAELFHMSARNLSRLFKSTTGITIGSYRENLRIELANQMLAENFTFDVIASACGLKSVSHLRSLLKKHKAKTPSQMLK